MDPSRAPVNSTTERTAGATSIDGTTLRRCWDEEVLAVGVGTLGAWHCAGSSHLVESGAQRTGLRHGVAVARERVWRCAERSIASALEGRTVRDRGRRGPLVQTLAQCQLPVECPACEFIGLE